MSDEMDELGPVDYLIVEFPAGQANFSGEMADALTALVETGTIRVLDLLIITKDDDGAIDAFEADAFEGLDGIRTVEAALAGILAEDDVENLAAAMEPGSVAAVLVWENLWAAPFASAARRAGGQLVATGRIPIQDILASLEADLADETSLSEGD